MERLRQEGSIPSTPTSVTNDPFFIYTSNVDAHFLRHFHANEVYELHGSLENWQCAGNTSDGKVRPPCSTSTWQMPSEVRFRVNTETMTTKDGGVFATCQKQCKKKARPNVLMFHDKNWIANVNDENRYVAWEAVMEQMLEDDPAMKLVVLEIGCGTRVPSVRKETEMVVTDVWHRCVLKAVNKTQSNQVCLVRINPDFPDSTNNEINTLNLILSLRMNGLSALRAIDDALSWQTSPSPLK